MPKRVLIFSLAYYPKHIGGAEIAIREITDRISSDDIEFHMITNRFDATLPRVEKIGNVLVHRIGITTKNPEMKDLRTFPLHLNKILFQFLAYQKAKALHRTYRYDGVWAMMAHATGIPAALFKKKFSSVKYILTLQEGDPLPYIEKKMRILGAYFKAAFTSADVVQAISRFLGAWAADMGFCGDAIIIPNAVDVAHFSKQYTSEERAEAAALLGKKEGEVFLVTTSRLVHKNAVDDVIRALALLPEHVHFVVYGAGPDEVLLRTLVRELSLSARVHFMGHAFHDELPLRLSACDIFIRPSRSEGMGNSFVEAMAAGLPVIATHEGGIPDFLFDATKNPGKAPTGWVVEKDNPESIKDAVLAIMYHPESVASVLQNAKAMVTEKYDWDIVAKRMQSEVFSIL